MPLGIYPVDRVLENRGGAEVVFRGDEHEAVGLRDRGGPFLDNRVLESRAIRRSGSKWLIEERHRKFAQIEKPSVDTRALLQVMKNPVRRLLRETALAGTSNNDGNDVHALDPCCSPKEKSSRRKVSEIPR